MGEFASSCFVWGRRVLSFSVGWEMAGRDLANSAEFVWIMESSLLALCVYLIITGVSRNEGNK